MVDLVDQVVAHQAWCGQQQRQEPAIDQAQRSQQPRQELALDQDLRNTPPADNPTC